MGHRQMRHGQRRMSGYPARAQTTNSKWEGKYSHDLICRENAHVSTKKNQHASHEIRRGPEKSEGDTKIEQPFTGASFVSVYLAAGVWQAIEWRGDGEEKAEC